MPNLPIDPNTYIVQKDAEWVRRWEDREVTFRKEIANLRTAYESKIAANARYFYEKETLLSTDLHRQQAIILKIRDDLPVIGKWILKWAGYKE